MTTAPLSGGRQQPVLSFLQECKDHPEDDTPRLVFADWLEEQGDPRGTLMRLQCTRARLSPLDPRCLELQQQEQDLLRQHGQDWLRPYQGLPGKVSFERGLLRLAAGREMQPLRTSLADADLAWLEELHYWGTPPEEAISFYERLLPLFSRVNLRITPSYGQRPFTLPSGILLPQLRSLNLAGCRLGNGGAEVLASWPGLVRLTHLSLAGNNLDEAGVQALANAPWFPRLSSLDLADNADLGAKGVETLACSGLFTRLTSLNLSGNAVGPAILQALLRHSRPGLLQSLQLRDTRLTDEDVLLLANSPVLAQVRTLDLAINNLGATTGAALAASPSLGNLTVLDLSYNRLGDFPLASWVGSPRLRSLRILHLGNTRLDDQSCAGLDRVSVEAPLAVLVLRRNSIGDGGLLHLLRSPLLARLGVLDLSSNQLRATGARWLAETAQAATLKVLHIDNNEIGEEGALALARSPHLRGLHHLHASGNKLLAAGRRALLKGFGDRVEV